MFVDTNPFLDLNTCNSSNLGSNFVGLNDKSDSKWREKLAQPRFGDIKLKKFMSKYYLHSQSSLAETLVVRPVCSEFKMSLNSFLLMDATNVLKLKGIGPKSYVAMVKRLKDLGIDTKKYSVCKLARKLSKRK